MALPGKQMTRNHISSFVHSLHLLDLDLLEDWPGVSTETFDSKSNLQHRLRCVEWSLYRLFELHDPRITREKLLPFFPPATSLQSINLRAALFRQLTELKKDGRLGQNVVLRKTMLDECKGDKFEELVAAFAIFVLKRVKKLSVNDIYDNSRTRSEHLLPLIVSHRKVIQQDLVKRKELGLKAERQQQLLQAELKDLATREAEIRQAKAPKLPNNADLLQKIVHENWLGDAQWIDAILHGQPPDITSDRSLADQSLEEHENGNGAANPPDFLSDLSSRVSMQNARLVNWQKCLKDLQRSHVVERSGIDEHVQQTGTLRFSRHQKLHSDSTTEDREITLKPEHAALLESLEKGLAQPGKQRPRQLQKTTKAHVRNELSNTAASSHAAGPRASTTEKAVNSADTGVGSSQHSKHQKSSDPPSVTFEDVTNSDHVNMEQQERMQVLKTPSPSVQNNSSLLERTKASLAHLVNYEADNSTTEQSTNLPREDLDRTVTTARGPVRPDRSSLLDRTRESMSLLTSAVEDTSRRRSGLRKSLHSKSKSVNVPSHTRRLEKAWSEQPIAPKTAKDDFDVEADYASVFKSRPKLAMSPNLSPQRNDLFDEFLEEGMKKLTIEPTL